MLCKGTDDSDVYVCILHWLLPVILNYQQFTLKRKKEGYILASFFFSFISMSKELKSVNFWLSMILVGNENISNLS